MLKFVLHRTEFCRIIPQYLSKYKPLRLMLPNNVADKAIEFFKFKKIYNSFNIVQEKEGALECYFFGTDHNSPIIKDFYWSHLESLEEFITYFHRIAGELMNSIDITRQGTLPFIGSTFPQIETIFKSTTPWEESIIKFNALLHSSIKEEICEISKRNLLTSRELECLSLVSIGMTAKEIARRFNIGYRTIETHLNNIRVKTGCHTKRELTYWFEDKFKCFLVTEE